MTSHLRNACIPLVQLRQAAADRLASILSEIDGPKALVLGPDLSGPLVRGQGRPSSLSLSRFVAALTAYLRRACSSTCRC